MMDYKACLLLLLGVVMFSTSNAQQYAENKKNPAGECQRQAKANGNGKEPFKIEKSCLEQVRNSAEFNNQDTSLDGMLRAFSYQNAIVFEKMKKNLSVKTGHVAGEQTKLKDISMTRVDNQENEIYVLQREEGIFSVFSTSYSGNVAPIRSFSSEELKKAKAFALEAERRKLFFVFSKPFRLASYRFNVDEKGRRSKNNTSILDVGNINANEVDKPIDLLIHKKRNVAVILDEGRNQLISYPLPTKVYRNQFLTPISVYDLPQREANFKRLLWKTSDKESIQVYDAFGKYTEINIDDVSHLDE